jgi:hypothetical protein
MFSVGIHTSALPKFGFPCKSPYNLLTDETFNYYFQKWYCIFNHFNIICLVWTFTAWSKWINRNNALGWQELINQKELSPALRAVIISEIENLTQRQEQNELTELEIDKLQHMKQLIRKNPK